LKFGTRKKTISTKTKIQKTCILTGNTGNQEWLQSRESENLTCVLGGNSKYFLSQKTPSYVAVKSEMSEPGTSSSVIRGLGETPTRVSVIIDNPAYRPSGPSSNADVQTRHNSISETNLIPKEQKSRSWNDLHDPTNQQADQNGNDSDGSGLS